MNIFELILTSISLGMDAFGVSISLGMNNNTIKYKESSKIALFFGTFQFIMPIIGYYLGNLINTKFIFYNNIIATILLILIGFFMIKDKKEVLKSKINLKELLILSIITSLDALIIGITLSLLKDNIFKSSLLIGLITYIMCFIGNILGNKLNLFLGSKTNKISGITLILIGFKILIESL